MGDDLGGVLTVSSVRTGDAVFSFLAILFSFLVGGF